MGVWEMNGFLHGCNYRSRKGVVLVEQGGQTENNHEDEMSAFLSEDYIAALS